MAYFIIQINSHLYIGKIIMVIIDSIIIITIIPVLYLNGLKL